MPKETRRHIILFGLDKKSRPHGSRFPEKASKRVKSAAEIMGFQFALAETPKLAEIAAHLPEGRFFKSGRAFTPYMGRVLYRRLLKALPAPIMPTPRQGSGHPRSPHQRPPEGDWWPAGVVAPPRHPAGSAKYPQRLHISQQARGQVVLASTGPRAGWWPARVARVVPPLLILQWLEPEGHPAFVRRADQVALLHPAAPALA